MQSNPRYTVAVERDPVFGVDAYVLRDLSVGSQARLLPALGNNLIGFTAMMSYGPLEILLHPDPDESKPQVVRYGIPILFPFPNRVRNATYAYGGRRFHLEVNTPDGHHIHGLVRGRAWRVTAMGSTLTGAQVRSRFDAREYPEVVRQVPSPFTLDVTYTLSGNAIRAYAEAQNVGTRDLPMGFGLHPYFRLPLATAARPYDCQVCVPAGRLWRLDHAKIPTGVVETVPADLDYRACQRLGEAELDHLYCGLMRENGLATCRLLDSMARADLRVRFGPEFPAVVVFAPADRPTICFEPYTCVSNAVNLPPTVPNTGLLVLPPGGKWQGRVDFVVAELAGEA